MSVVIPIFKRDVMNYEAYRGVKLLEHAMKIVESVLESRIRLLVNLDEMEFGFMPGKGATDALFLIHRMQEEYRNKGKPLYMCFVDLEKAFECKKNIEIKGNPCTCALLIWKRHLNARRI